MNLIETRAGEREGSRKILENRAQEREKQIAPHRVTSTDCLLSYRPQLSTGIQCARNHHYQYHISFFLFTDQVTLLFVGDITFSGPVRYYVEHNHQSYNTCFVEVASFIRGADISVANLETPLVNATVFSHKCQKQVVLDSSPQSASSLR